MNDKTKSQTIEEESLEQVQGGAGNGSQLLGHELTHVGQNRGGVASTAGGNPEGVASTASGNPEGVKKVITGDMGKGDI